jgi:small GTP-binding protein
MEKNNNEPNKDKEIEFISSDYSSTIDLSFKIIVIGDSGVGKTCLTIRASKGIYTDEVSGTIGFEFFPIIMKYKNKIIKLDIWDTCGQEDYRSLIKSFFTGSSLAIIVYAINE